MWGKRCLHLRGCKTESDSLRQEDDPNKEDNTTEEELPGEKGFQRQKCWCEKEGTRKERLSVITLRAKEDYILI